MIAEPVYDESYHRFMSEADAPLPAAVTISTMTIYCTFSWGFQHTRIMRDLVLSADDIAGVVSDTLRIVPEFALTYTKKKCKNFQNSVTVLVHVGNSRLVNVKLFSNGTIHITGCRSVADFEALTRKLVARLSADHMIPNGEPLRLSNVITAMIKADFKFKFHINLKQMYEVMHELRDVERSVDLDQNRHQSVNIAYLDNGTKVAHLLVFGTGSTIVTGNSMRNIIRGYNFIVQVVRANQPQLVNKSSLISEFGSPS